MSAIPAQAAQASSSTHPAEASPTLVSRIEEIMGIKPQAAQSIANQLNKLYPGIHVKERLGNGEYSVAYLCIFRRPDQPEGKIVLKMSDFSEAKQEKQSGFNLLHEDRIGGEWFALLDFDDHVVKTKHAIAYNYTNRKPIIVSDEEVQNLYHNENLREGKKWLFMGSVSEFIEGSVNFYTALKGGPNLSVEAIRNLGKQMIEGLKKIHEQGQSKGMSLVHRDIKPENMLFIPPKKMDLTAALDQGLGKVVFLDFGFAKMMEQTKKRHTGIGSPICMAPEMLKKELEYTPAVDAYALAATLSGMASKWSPSWITLCTLHQHNASVIRACMDKSPHKDNYQLMDLITKLGHPDFEKRLTITQALVHPFFTAPTSKQPIANESTDPLSLHFNADFVSSATDSSSSTGSLEEYLLTMQKQHASTSRASNPFNESWKCSVM